MEQPTNKLSSEEGRG